MRRASDPSSRISPIPFGRRRCACACLDNGAVDDAHGGMEMRPMAMMMGTISRPRYKCNPRQGKAPRIASTWKPATRRARPEIAQPKTRDAAGGLWCARWARAGPSGCPAARAAPRPPRQCSPVIPRQQRRTAVGSLFSADRCRSGNARCSHQASARTRRGWHPRREKLRCLLPQWHGPYSASKLVRQVPNAALLRSVAGG